MDYGSRLSLACFASVLLAVLPACGTDPALPDGSSPDGSRMDATADGTSDGAPADGAPCTTNAQCNDNLFCNGEERCQGGVCTPAARPPCDDGRSCTMDSCDEAARMCTNAPDDAMCGDTNACNGRERCNPGAPGALPTGCEPVQAGNVIDCDDTNTCTIDSCDPTSGCVHSPRDLDGDGHVDRACTLDGTPAGPPGDDCNDGEPTAYPGAAEVCDDGVDNDCNGSSDYFDPAARCMATNDTCTGVRVLPGSGVYSATVNGLSDNQRLSCNTSTGVPDAVFAFVLAAPADVRATVNGSVAGAAIALATSCEPFAERACGRTVSAGGTSAPPTVFARSLPAGTHYLVLEMPAGSGAFRFTLNILAPTTAPAGDACPPTSAPVDLASGVAAMANLSMLTDDFSVTCNPGLPTRDGVFRLRLPAARNVDLRASATGGTTFVSLRAGACEAGSQLRCVSGASMATTSLRSVPAGDYFVVVENSLELPVTVTATLTDPGVVATGDACRAPAVVPLAGAFPQTGAVTIDGAGLLAGADHGTSCGSGGNPDGWRDAVATFTLAATSDVTVTVNATSGAAPYFWSLSSTCGLQSSQIGRCNNSVGTTPAARRFYGLPAGTYGVVLESTAATSPGYRVQVDAQDPAARPRYEACGGAVVALTGSGATLSGALDVDLASPVLDRTAQHGTACGSASTPDGWTDVVFQYTLTDRRNVTIGLASAAPTFWFTAVESTCGARGSAVLACQGDFASGGLTAPFTRTLMNQAPGTYFIIAENTAPTQSALRVTITATTP